MFSPRAYIELMRPANCLISVFAVFIGSYLGGGSSGPALAAAFLICAGGNAINDYFDRSIDAINKKHRPIPSGRVRAEAALFYSGILFVAGVFLAYLINAAALVIAVVNSLLLILYAAQLKKTLLLGNVVVSFLVGSTFIFGGAAVGNPQAPLLLAILGSLSNMAREIMKSVEDQSADKKAGAKTAPIVWGEKTARFMAAAFMIVTVALSPLPYIMGVLKEAYLALVFVADLLFFYVVYKIFTGADAKRIHGMMKLGMLLVLLSFLAGSL